MRADLRALTSESLALLSNVGLVKRAQKEIAAGQGPVVEEEADGTVLGTFPDGVETRLPPARALKDCPCSCNSIQVCRHRLATVLVYLEQPEHEESPDAGPVDAKAYLGARLYEKALKLRASTRARVESPQLVQLDTCSVHFLSGQRLEFARCDCSATGPCEHMALALWALQGEGTATRQLDVTPLEPALALVRELLSQGVSHLGEGLGTRFEEARRLLQRHSLVWPATLLEGIEQELAYYRAASGRYRAASLARQAASLWARHRDGSDAALGLNLAPETSLQKVRLTGLGCRVEKDETSFFLADTSRVLVLPCATGRSPGGLKPRTLAGGQLVSAAAHRRANGLLRLGRGPHSLGLCKDWKHLGGLHGLPSRGNDLLGECHAAPGIRILDVTAVVTSCYSPGQQELSLMVHTLGGETVRLALAHRAAAPFALECLWEARDDLQAVAGPMEREGLHWKMQPSALLVGGEVRVPDLADGGTLEGADLGTPPLDEDPLAGALDDALSCWNDVVHRGLGSGQQRRVEVVARLRKVGLERTARQLEEARDAEDWLRLAARLEVAREFL